MQLPQIQSLSFRLPVRAAGGPRRPEQTVSQDSLTDAFQGRPNPAADAAFLRQAVPDGKPEELAYLYLVGRKFYGEGKSEELLTSSLQGFAEWIDKPWEGSILARLSRPERIAMLEKLVVAAPPEHKEYVLHHSDVLRPLEYLDKMVIQEQKPVPNNSAHLGPNERVSFASTTPQHRMGIHEAVDSYLGYLDRILHADGRVDSTKRLNEDQAAWSCVWVEQNVLHREPGQVEDFKSLVSFYHSPWPALGVMQQADLVPSEKRQEFFALMRDRVQTNREQVGAPENSQDHAKEGDYVGRMSKFLALMLRAQRAGQSLSEVEDELRDARAELKETLARWLPREALSEAISIRGPQESTASATRRLQALYELVEQLFEHENDPQGHLKLAGELGRQQPERAEELQDCMSYLRRLNPPKELVAPAIQAAYAAEGSPMEFLRERFRSLELTGSLDGLDKIGQEIEAGLAEGRLRGTPEQLMARFLERLESLNLVHDDHKVSFHTAREEFFQGPAGNTVGYVNGRLTIGGVRIGRRS